MTTTDLATMGTCEVATTNYVRGDINTFNLATDEGKLATLSVINNAESLARHVGEVLEVTDCITMPGTRKSRDARIPDSPCTNVYLVTRDGKAFMSQSGGIADSVATIAALFPDFGKASERGYLPLSVIEQELSNGNTIKKLVPVV